MKKIITLVLVAVMALSMVACGGNTDTNTTTAPNSTTAPNTTTAPQVQGPASALDALNAVWTAFGEEGPFFAMGGDYENNVMGTPGAVSLATPDFLTGALLVPEAQLANVTECASLMHGMLTNNFTCGAFKVNDVNAFATAMKDAIKNNHWMCGMPEKVTIVDLGGNYVVVAFGINDAMSPFFAKLADVHTGATTLVDEAIA